VKPKPSLPPGDFRLLIRAINRGTVRDIEDEAARLARIAINAKRRKARNSSGEQVSRLAHGLRSRD
jgi:hypothetical protein